MMEQRDGMMSFLYVLCCSCWSVAQPCLTLLRHHGLQPARLFCPWDFPDKNIRLVCHDLLQGIFSTLGSNPHLLHWQVYSLPLSHQGIYVLQVLYYMKQVTPVPGNSSMLFCKIATIQIFRTSNTNLNTQDIDRQFIKRGTLTQQT